MSVPQLGKPNDLKFARSPQFLTGRNDFVSTDDLFAMDVNLSVYTGLQSASVPTDIVLEKLYAINRRINFEVGDVVRTKFVHDFNIWDNQDVIASPLGEVLWSKITGDWTYSNAGSAPVTASIGTNYWYSTDGWHDKFTPSNASYVGVPMAVDRLRRCPSTGYDMFPVQYDSVNGNLEAIGYTINNVLFQYDIFAETGIVNTSLQSNEKVLYIPCGFQNVYDLATSKGWELPEVGSTICIGLHNATWPDGTEPPEPLFQFCVEFPCEIKYEAVPVAFVNRYGVMDIMYFFKASTEVGEFSRQTYNRSVYQDAFTAPDIQQSKYEDYNINARNTWTLNSDWVEEAYNDVAKDILMSEQVAIYLNNEWIGVQVVDTNLDYKKEVNEKLINITMQFKIAWDERTLVR
jgi:hypothetical protein